MVTVRAYAALTAAGFRRFTTYRQAAFGGAVANIMFGFLRRERHVVSAVDGVDLSVERGELLGYIGPNGAGKSTTLKMMTGVLTPSD